MAEVDSYEEISKGSDIPLTAWQKYIDLSFIDIDVDLTKDPTPKHLTTYFAQVMMEIIWLHLDGNALLSLLRESFDGWTTHEFSQVQRTFKGAFIKILQDKNVQGAGKTQADQLASIVQDLQPGIEKEQDISSFVQQDVPPLLLPANKL